MWDEGAQLLPKSISKAPARCREVSTTPYSEVREDPLLFVESRGQWEECKWVIVNAEFPKCSPTSTYYFMSGHY